MSERDEQPDVVGRLLEGRDGFSRAERAAMFDDVFSRVEAEAPAAASSRRPWWAGVLALGAAIALAVIVAQPTTPADEEFRARGQSTNLELRCTGDGACAAGDALTFELVGTELAFFAAFARGASGDVIWYFPEDADGQSIAIEDGSTGRAVKLGADHAGSTWTVYAVLSAAPLTRDQIRASFDESGEFVRPDGELLTRQLVVE